MNKNKISSEKLKPRFGKALSTCLVAFLFVASFTFLAVSLALSSLTINAKGKIYFKADNVLAKVVGTVSGTETENTLEELNFDENTSKDYTTPSSWQNMTLDFDSNNLITLTISIQNLNTEEAIYVTFSDEITASNLNVVRKVDGTTITEYSKITIAKSSTKVITIQLSVSNLNKSVDGDLTLGISMATESANSESGS